MSFRFCWTWIEKHGSKIALPAAVGQLNRRQKPGVEIVARRRLRRDEGRSWYFCAVGPIGTAHRWRAAFRRASVPARNHLAGGCVPVRPEAVRHPAHKADPMTTRPTPRPAGRALGIKPLRAGRSLETKAAGRLRRSGGRTGRACGSARDSSAGRHPSASGGCRRRRSCGGRQWPPRKPRYPSAAG